MGQRRIRVGWANTTKGRADSRRWPEPLDTILVSNKSKTALRLVPMLCERGRIDVGEQVSRVVVHLNASRSSGSSVRLAATQTGQWFKTGSGRLYRGEWDDGDTGMPIQTFSEYVDMREGGAVADPPAASKGMPRINAMPETDARRKPNPFKPAVRHVTTIVPQNIIPKLKPTIVLGPLELRHPECSISARSMALPSILDPERIARLSPSPQNRPASRDDARSH